jgi:hypothetical protein
MLRITLIICLVASGWVAFGIERTHNETQDRTTPYGYLMNCVTLKNGQPFVNSARINGKTVWYRDQARIGTKLCKFAGQNG